MSNTITIQNTTKSPVYVYDFDMSLKPLEKTLPLSGGNPLAAGDTMTLTMKPKGNPGKTPSRRIYFSHAELKASLGGGGPQGVAAPDAYTPWYDGNIMFSFAEYNYEPSDDRYTFDLSYIDTFSYPLTATFEGGNEAGYVIGHEYGFTSLSAVRTELNTQSAPAEPWAGLIWPTDNPTSPTPANWPTGIYRVIGPNKVWTSNSYGMSGYAPTPYQNFVQALPFNGTQLFAPAQNYTEWLNSETSPANTGYVKALRQSATADKNGKIGFFTYPKDNAQGEFTWLPMDAVCTIKIYPFDA